MKAAASLALLFATAALPLSAQAADFFIPGNLVVSVEGNGVVGASSGSYTDNQAAPLSLFQYKLNGTNAPATYVNSLVLPQTASGANHAISGEYGSTSEGGLQLTGDGRSLVIAGYGVNAATFNANPTGFGTLTTDPTKSTALGQSGSLTGQGYTAVPRVIAVIGSNASVDTTTALNNVFNGNNPRSVASADGTSFYISGQGNNPDAGPDNTGGVFYAKRGASTATAVTGLDTHESKTDATPAAQDTRIVHIVNGQLYVSVDSKEGNGFNRDFIGTLGGAGALPTGLANGGGGPAQLSNFATSGAGKQSISFATGNGINVVNPSDKALNVNLSPEDYFFADPNTLYVADGGDPKNDSQNTIGDGGLQKWTFDGKNWNLQYTLSDGLNLVADTNTCTVPGVATPVPCGTTGLLGLTGEVVGGKVELFATNFTLGDTDQTYLYGITDLLSATTKTKPSESFVQLAVAPADSTFKGVAFAPVPEPATWALMLGGFGLAGAALRRRRAALA